MYWIAAAVLLFWSVGAYNRLVRLRAEANAAFATLDAEMLKQVQLAEACLPDGQTQAASLLDVIESSFWGGLQGAAAQFSASLAVARHKPLQPDSIAALRAAQDVLTMAWERAERDDAHNMAGPRLPQSLSTTRAHMTSQAFAAAEHFNRSVARYNDAIAQFPALILAWLFGFRPGRAL